MVKRFCDNLKSNSIINNSRKFKKVVYMKFTNQTKIYLHIALLLLFTFLLANQLLTSIKTNNYNYLRFTLRVAAILVVVFQIINLRKNKQINNDNKR